MGLHVIDGPFQGMDWRETSAGEKTCRVSLNVDTSRGYIEARQPQKRVAVGAPARARLHYVSTPELGASYVLAVGPEEVGLGNNMKFTVYDPETWDVLGTQDLTSDLGVAPEWGNLAVSFVDTYLPPVTAGVLRPVTLVVLAGTTLVWEPLIDPGALVAVDMSADAIRRDSSVYAFWNTPPHGRAAVIHNEQLWFAGIATGQTTWTVAISADDTSVDQRFAATTTAFNLAPTQLWFSDPGDLLGVYAGSLFVLPEPILGLYSTGEALLVWTQSSLWLVTGENVTDYRITRLARGVNFVSQSSIVSDGPVVYWMGDDGVYAFGGLSAPEVVCISEAIAPLWSGGYSATAVPDGLRVRLGNFKWPFHATVGDLGLCVGRKYHGRNQIWWSLSVGSPWGPAAPGLTLVLDLRTMGWHFYCQTPNGNRSNGTHLSCMADAVDIGGRWVTSNGNTELQVSGEGAIADGVVGSTPGPTTTAAGVPMVWVSQRIFGMGADLVSMQGVWLKLLGTGVPTSLGGSVVGSSSVAFDLPGWGLDGEEAVFDDESSEGTVVTDYDQRRARYAALQLHAQPDAGYFWGTAVYGTDVYGSVDFFTSHADVSMVSRAFVVSVADDAWTNCLRAPMTVIASIALEADGLGEPNQ